ncbi:hypothetical protein [Nonomuraea sp. NPDC052265]|uniref:hypothetical protein n=1 Tax=Nonomuraea sp. NPDC052265 TaxID=3364374 RepID=UPI0037CC9A42
MIFFHIDSARKYLVDAKKENDDAAVRQECVGQLRLLRSHPDLQNEAHTISLLITRAWMYEITTADLQREVRNWQEKADKTRT